MQSNDETIVIYPQLHDEFLVNRNQQAHPVAPSFIVEQVPSAPNFLEDRHSSLCQSCNQIIGEQDYLVFKCQNHFIHKDCSGILHELGQTMLPFECYLCHFKGNAEHLEFNDTIDDITLSFPKWVSLIGLKNMAKGLQTETNLKLISDNKVDMKKLLKIPVAFQNVMAICKGKNRPTFLDWIEFGLTPEIFENEEYRHLFPLNRVISEYRLTYNIIKKDYYGQFEFSVNRLPKMGGDYETLRCLNLDAPLLAQYKATRKTILNLQVPYRAWTKEFRMDHSLLKMWNLRPEDFKK